MSIFTRREKIILGLVIILMSVFAIFPNLMDREYELFYLVFIVAPAGYLIATDKERIARSKDKE